MRACRWLHLELRKSAPSFGEVDDEHHFPARELFSKGFGTSLHPSSISWQYGFPVPICTAIAEFLELLVVLSVAFLCNCGPMRYTRTHRPK